MSRNLEIIVGTYEQFVLGYTVDDIVNKYKMEQSFATHSHLASVRSVACNKHYLASAAADDTVCLYDMRTRTENGKLVHHNDTVNSISFTPDASHIISVSSDGTIGIVRCGNWQVEKHWLKPHKGLGVDTLAVHPSGKIAMTTGHDGVLRTWNLVKGRQAYATNLVPRWKLDAKSISVLKWSPNGNSYLIAANNKIDIYSVETAGIEEEISFDSKVICIEYLDDESIAIGLADGKISIYNLENGSQSNEIQAHDTRVKCLARSDDLLVSASSSGEIKLWSTDKDKLTILNKVNCNARISCLALTTCQSTNYKKDEIDLEEKVLEKSSNKLRTKQRVIIEEENNEEKQTRMSKRKRNQKKAQKLLEESNLDTENISITKKIKTNVSDKLLPKKNKRESSDIIYKSAKKKKLQDFPKKRKDSPELNDDEITEIPIKKKKKAHSIPGDVEVNSKQNNTNMKKRKIPSEDAIANSLMKGKAIGVTVGKNTLTKKKRKKNF